VVVPEQMPTLACYCLEEHQPLHQERIAGKTYYQARYPVLRCHEAAPEALTPVRESQPLLSVARRKLAKERLTGNLHLLSLAPEYLVAVAVE
jgi:hypothetical protein